MVPFDKNELSSILEAAKIRPRLRRDIKFFPERIVDWAERDFLAIMNRGGTEGVLVMPNGTRSTVVSFSLSKRMPNRLGRIESIICDICATWQRGTHSAVITFDKGDSTVSYLCCGDLLCSFHVRNKTAAARLSRAHLREDMDIPQRVERLRRRLARIVE